ncbi:glycosyltransferase family 1 protein [Thermoflexus sp.]|uniref:glycosyltransferase family 4 protein n=1 Tax=Thermoflexus sp. TaxID=1969742 RepID=UPI0025CD0926|nr:glycosyltransferase family 1 protein [Thermoflexus sp.]MCS6963884.1 glycosyltransferase family 4 protein [Thermoflexus sp.]MCS7351245.1 glycosyltransferase family 4 protein [Thermoflexus sp.]MCX7689743.1 glycosyltransferase family 4 protein [Thermoflexus sp.]MDW8180699.1 glycosyltransferase family 1 protein [Anaerolineae bacterium]
MPSNSTRIRIALNAQLLAGEASYRSAGIHRYIYEVLRRLPQAAPDIAFTAFIGPRSLAPEALGIRWVRTTWPTHRPAIRILWEQLAFPLLLAREDWDLLHAMAFVAPLAVRMPVVVTVYDLSFVRYPEAFRAWNRIYLRLFTRLSCQRAAGILTISQAAREDLIRLWKLPPERIGVAYPGVDLRFRPLPEGEVATFRARHGLPEQFILYVGTLEPRKNLEILLDAIARLSPPVPLILVGGRGWKPAFLSRLQMLEREGRARWIGFVPDTELPLWYNAATLFVYPSRYEGFGMPPLEAMACGTPVIAARASSLPEVVGEAGLLIDPDDVEGWAEGIRTLLRDGALREALRAQGLARAQQFTWEATVKAITGLYNKIV